MTMAVIQKTDEEKSKIKLNTIHALLSTDAQVFAKVSYTNSDVQWVTSHRSDPSVAVWFADARPLHKLLGEEKQL